MATRCMFRKTKPMERRCYNFENATMKRGQGGRENNSAKGHAFDRLNAGETKTLLDVSGSGVIDHIWITFNTVKGIFDPVALRAVTISMYWDDAPTPAVCAPIGDFFGIGAGGAVSFECELFSCPQARAFNCYIQMPFLRSARITLTNESDTDLQHVFYTINYYLDPELNPDGLLYFHTHWRRENPTQLMRDFEILPHVTGAGRYLGANISVQTDPRYRGSWWGEGEVKIYLDGDGAYPTIIGTGAEDYPGTAWGLDPFAHRYQGCLTAQHDQGRWSFYRYHIPDPIFFDTECRVTMQQIGGCAKETLLALRADGVPFEMVSVDQGDRGFIRVFETEPRITLNDPAILPEDWCNFYRVDDWAATSYFYLNRPDGILPPLADVQSRIVGVSDDKGTNRHDG